MGDKTTVTTAKTPSPSIRAARQTLRTFSTMLPILLGVLLLMSLLGQWLPQLLESGLFGRGALQDALMGASLGGIFAGHPLVSYVLGGELSAAGVGLVGVTAVVVAWVTVGVTHLPLEAKAFDWRFALMRNGLAFISAILAALFIGGSIHVLS